MKIFKPEPIDNVTVALDQNCMNMPEKEIRSYITWAKKQLNPGVILTSISLKLVGEDDIDVEYEWQEQGFERIRRITGYLVGTVNRFNNAKREEEHDRVKHTFGLE